MVSRITEISPAASHEALDYFQSTLRFETDCWDVHDAFASGKVDFILLDVRSPALYSAGHIPGAINLPHAKIIESKLAQFAKNSVFVVYCAGPHCNGAHRGAIRLAALGRPVKLMMGGITGWLDEGFLLESDRA